MIVAKEMRKRVAKAFSGFVIQTSFRQTLTLNVQHHPMALLTTQYTPGTT